MGYLQFFGESESDVMKRSTNNYVSMELNSVNSASNCVYGGARFMIQNTSISQAQHHGLSPPV